ncbi:MAG: hypothetical protein ACK2UR_03185 [Candidatus Promineifilaceae bacterium]
MKLSPTARKFLFGFLVVSSLFLACAILLDWLPWLRGPAPETSEWYWPYLLRPVARWWPSAAAALLTLIVSALWLRQERTKRSWALLFLTLLFACSLLLQLSLIYADRANISAELVDRTLSNQASGFFEAAAEITDINQLLAAYPRAMPLFVSEHARTHPPGMIVANWAAIQVMEKMNWLADPVAAFVRPLRCMDLWLYGQPTAVPAALGVWALIPLLFAAATLFPAYGAARLLLPDSHTAKLATVLAALMPALILFAPKSVQLYAPLALLMFWAFHAGLLQKSAAKLFLAGLVGSMLTFFSLGNAALFLLLALYAIFIFLLSRQNDQQDDLWRQDRGQIAWQLLAFGAGAAAIWLVYLLFWQVAPWEIAGSGLKQHYQLVTNIRRYEWWVVWNLIDLVIYGGWPLVLGFLGSLVLAYRLWRNRKFRPVDALAVVLAILILVLNFSGSARGEVGRLWLFFMPLLAFPAAHFWQRALPGKQGALVVIALQLLMILSLGWAWRPVRAVIVVAEEPVMAQAEPQTELDENFAGEPLKLTGYTLASNRVSAGENIALALFWQAAGPASRPYTVFNHLVDKEGQLVAQQDNWPVNGQWPPSCWRDGDVIVDEYSMAIPPDAETGSYRLVTGLYDTENGARLLLEDGRDGVELDVVEVEK